MWIEVQGALGALDAWILLGGTDFELGADSDDLNGPPVRAGKRG